MATQGSRAALQERVTTAILDGAARTFSVAGEQASMNQIAEAAGVARATVYRYFASRDALLDDLIDRAIGQVEAGLASARIDEVAPREGIVRAIRALVEVGDPFVVLTRERPRFDAGQYERQLVVPLRRLLERAQAAGEIRDDVSAHRLIEALVGLIVGLLTSTAPLGREDLTAIVSGLFWDGARARGPQPG